MEEKQKDKERKPKASKQKVRQGSGYLKQLYSTARTTAGSTHSNLKNLTTFMVNLIPTEKVDASELQVRTHFDEEEIQALSHSIKQHGVLQPVLVVQDGDRYKVIAGERRLRATKLAGLDRIPARVITSDDKSTHEIALRENLDRVDLHPVEEGEAYLSLLETQAFSSHESIAKAFGKPKSRITECIGFTKLPARTKEELMRCNIKARSILRKLLSTEPEKHLTTIADLAKIDEAQAIAQSVESESKSKPKKSSDTQGKDQPQKPYTYQVKDKAVVVPGFRWKIGEGPERLQDFIKAAQNLVEDLERVHSSKLK